MHRAELFVELPGLDGRGVLAIVHPQSDEGWLGNSPSHPAGAIVVVVNNRTVTARYGSH